MIENLTPEEEKAIKLLKKLEKIWPKSLVINCTEGTLSLHRTGPHDTVEEFESTMICSLSIKATDGCGW